jgi:PQQ-dependent catabolism-associated CXXCW motif protein
MTSAMTRGTLARGIGISIGILSLLALVSTASAAQDRFPPRPTTRPGDTSRAQPNATPGNAAPRGVPNTNSNTNSNANANANADASSKMEREDFGVAPTRALHNGPMHGPTPASIPGGQVITTAGVLDMQRRGIPHVLVDVLGAPDMLPNAIPGAWLSQPGSFTDETQKRGAAMLMQATQGRKDTPLVFYCQSPQCWMSYNAALRAINAGFTNVLWYRGGVEAWSRNAGR